MKSQITSVKTVRRTIAERVEKAAYEAALNNFRKWECCDIPSKLMAFAMANLHGNKIATGDVFTDKEKSVFIRKGYSNALETYMENQ